METVDVIIPAYRPGKEFEKLLDSLSTQNYPVEKILVMNRNSGTRPGRKNFQK